MDLPYSRRADKLRLRVLIDTATATEKGKV